jgi:hypothetical protein
MTTKNLISFDPTKPPEPSKPEEPEDSRPSVTVLDAWCEAFDLARGIGELLTAIANHRDGIGENGGYALAAVGNRLIDQMTIVDAFFHPTKQE